MTRNETIASLAVNSWINGDRVIWPGADLSWSDLSGTYLVRAKLAGANLFLAFLSRADLRWSDLSGCNLSLADMGKANLRGSDLSRAALFACDLDKADLSNSELYYTNLSQSSLRGAVLIGCALTGAALSGADLFGAEINGDTIAVHVTSADRDEYEFRLFRLSDGTHKVHAGCRWMTVDDYRAHVARYYPDTDKARRTLAILDYFEAVIGQ